jgi:hypothetical protein
MKSLYPMAPCAVAILMYIFLCWARRGGAGAVGRAIRNSDQAAWRDAVAQKEFELAELRKHGPK